MADQATGVLSGWLREARLRAATPHCVGRVLDYGCGVGKLATYVDPSCYLGFDIDAESIAPAKLSYPKHEFCTELPRQRQFDSVIALALIEHVPDAAAFVGQLREVLSPNGQIVLTSPHPYFEWAHTIGARTGLFSPEASDEHEQLFDRRGFEKLAQSARMKLVHYRRFLYGANQLAILRA